MIPKEEQEPTVCPPKRAERLLQFFLKEELAEEVLGDLEEKFFILQKERLVAAAKRNYWYQVLNYIRPFAVKNLSSPSPIHIDMYKHYFKVGFRNLKRNKGYALINIGGLGIGMAVALMIGLWINAELSYNTEIPNFDRIAQVMQHQSYNGQIQTEEVIPMPLGKTLSDQYAGDFEYVVMASWPGDHILSHEDKNLIHEGSYMDVDVTRLLSLNMLAGNRDGLKELGSILLASSAAKAFFGDADPLGKQMKIDNELAVTVTGVYEDLPSNSRFGELLFIAPWELYVSSYDWVSRDRERVNWDNNSYNLFTQIAAHSNMAQVSKKISEVKYANLNEAQKALESKLFLHPMTDWHLNSNWENGVKKGGFIQYIWLFGLIGIFVLLLACINFMNLSTAQSERRAKEVGVRKSLGSARGQLISQFLNESFLVVSLGYIGAILLVNAVLPFFNQLTNKEIVFPFLVPTFWWCSFIVVLITSLLAGSYPALYLSAFHPVKVLKGTFKAKPSATAFRRILVVVQFTVSVTLIICTIMVEKQVQHSKNRPIGYNNEGLIMIEINSPDYDGKYAVLRDELKKRGAIEEMTVSSSSLTDSWNERDNFHWQGKSPDFNALFSVVWVDHHFGETIGWDVTEGRDFSLDFSTDSTAFILNEAAVAYMGLEEPVGKTIKWGTRDHQIVGVIEDMLMESPFKKVQQTIYMIGKGINTNWIEVKLHPEESTANALAMVEEVFK